MIRRLGLASILGVATLAIVVSNVSAHCIATGQPSDAIECYCEAVTAGDIGAMRSVLAEKFGMDYLPKQRGSMTVSKDEHIRGAVTAMKVGGERAVYWTSGSASVTETGADTWRVSGLTLHRSVGAMVLDPVPFSFNVVLTEVDGQAAYQISKIDIYFE